MQWNMSVKYYKAGRINLLERSIKQYVWLLRNVKQPSWLLQKVHFTANKAKKSPEAKMLQLPVKVKIFGKVLFPLRIMSVKGQGHFLKWKNLQLPACPCEALYASKVSKAAVGAKPARGNIQGQTSSKKIKK